MTISVVLPAYLEEKNLEMLLPRLNDSLKKIGEPYEILIVDTVEPMDNTQAVCERYGARYIHREGGNLYGDAIRTGFDKANGRYVTIMDADGSHNPDDIVRMYQEMRTGRYDLIIGSRYCKGGYTDNGFVLKLMSRLLNVAYRVMFGLRVKDVSDSFRMYKADQVKQLELECDNFDVVEEILITLNYTIPGFAVKEIPISFNKRMAGESKRDLIKFIRSYFHTMLRLLRIKSKHQNKGK